MALIRKTDHIDINGQVCTLETAIGTEADWESSALTPAGWVLGRGFGLIHGWRLMLPSGDFMPVRATEVVHPQLAGDGAG